CLWCRDFHGEEGRDMATLGPRNVLRIGKSNFRLRSDLKSKDSTLQLMYDVLKLTPFYKAFLVTSDVPEIYMQEFWTTTTVHHHSIHFKMNNKKRIVNLEYFREMLQISPRIPNQQFDELPFEEEILAFLRELGHSREIKMITDVNINKLHQPWRSFAAVINKCLSGKSTEHKDAKKSNEMHYPRFIKVIVNFFMTKDQSIPRRNKEDFVYQVEHKDAKKSNEMHYPWFIKVIVNVFMTKDQSIPRGNKEYYAIASGAKPPKTKASVRKKKSSSDTTVPPPTKGKRLKTSTKIKLATKRSLTQTHISYASGSGADEGTGVIPWVPDVPNYESNDEEISWKSKPNDDDDQNDQDKDDDEQTDSDNDGDDFVHPKFSTHDEEAKGKESFDSIVQTPSHDDKTDDEDNDEDSDGMNVE
nr:hypothetical protein [Tanacetum cinerariifolium]